MNKLQEKYFNNQYVKLIEGPTKYKALVANNSFKPLTGKQTNELDFKLTTLALDPATNNITQFFIKHTLFSLAHEMGHWLTVSQEDSMKPAFGLNFVVKDSSEEWIENIAIPDEIGAFAIEELIAKQFNPQYDIRSRYIAFNSVLRTSIYFKSKYGAASLHELHPIILNKLNALRLTLNIDIIDQLWFSRNDYFLRNPVKIND